MNIFCLLWMPMVYRFRSGFSEDGDSRTGMVPALLSGLFAALALMPLAGLPRPSPFGFTRWIQGFAVVSAIPALIPILLRTLLYRKSAAPAIPLEPFVLLYAVPIGIVQSIAKEAQGGMLPLVVLPLLWTAQAIGIPGFLGLGRNQRGVALWASYAGAAMLPFAASTAYWLLFIQSGLPGAALALLCLAPAVFFLYGPWRRSMAVAAAGAEASAALLDLQAPPPQE